MLQDNKPHSTIDICKEVYGDEHLGLARVGARIWDLKKKYRLNIESWRDPKIKTIWWYQLALRGRQLSGNSELQNSGPFLPLNSPLKSAEQPELFKIKYDL